VSLFERVKAFDYEKTIRFPDRRKLKTLAKKKVTA